MSRTLTLLLATTVSCSGFVPTLPLHPRPRPRTEFRVAHAETRTDALTDKHDEDAHAFDRLFEILSPNEAGLVQLDESADGVRGVYTTRAVMAEQAIFTIPLDACLRDDDIPAWMGEESVDEDNETTEPTSYTACSWTKRLAGSLLDLQLDLLTASSSTSIAEPTQLWLQLLPDPLQLRATLPIHWTEDVLAAAHCTALELAVDAAYFTRAQVVGDLVHGVQQQDAVPLRPDQLHVLAENALDIVQTRTCRVVIPDDGTPLRLLAPLFDMLNHRARPNAAFAVERIDDGYDALVIRAIQDIPAQSEVYISYGASTKPSWRCLASYGFVPAYNPDEGDDDDEDYQEGEDMAHSAEVFLEGMRYKVGPGSVSQELVDAMAACMDPTVERPALLTTQVALRLAQRISESAFQMLLDASGTEALNSPGDDDDQADSDDEEDDDDDDSSEWSLAHVISARQAAALRWNQHRILMSCSLGLRDWAAKQM